LDAVRLMFLKQHCCLRQNSVARKRWRAPENRSAPKNNFVQYGTVYFALTNVHRGNVKVKADVLISGTTGSITVSGRNFKYPKETDLFTHK
jgi:hypothetical protein